MEAEAGRTGDGGQGGRYGRWASISRPCMGMPLTSRYTTLRPVKKVDAAGTVRLSNEYVGTGPVKVPSESTGQVGKKDSPKKSRAPSSAKGRAGQALVEEVILGVLDSVCSSMSTPSLC
jgi:hypothetical protein